VCCVRLKNNKMHSFRSDRDDACSTEHLSQWCVSVGGGGGGGGGALVCSACVHLCVCVVCVR